MKKTILIVDDFESSRNILGRALETAGYEIIHGEDGEKAMKILEGAEVDLVITDLNMPIMDGIDLIKNIRAKNDYQFMPVLLLTSNSRNNKREEAKEAGVTAWLEKPFKVDTLLINVKRIMR